MSNKAQTKVEPPPTGCVALLWVTVAVVAVMVLGTVLGMWWRFIMAGWLLR